MKQHLSRRGMTLIELMVGLAVGLITTLAITQIFLSSEGYRRRTVASSESQVNGAMALYALQQDLLAAGYGYATIPALLGCPVQWSSGGAVAATALAPVTITPGAGAQPDRLTVISGDTDAASLPMRSSAAHGAAATQFAVDASLGVQAGDLLVAAPAAWGAGAGCTLFAATAGVAANAIPHAATSPWNAQLAGRWPAAGYPSGSLLINLGRAFTREYSINAGTLQVRRVDAANPGGSTRDLIGDIVMLRALYAKDTNGDGVIDTYDNDNSTLVNAAGWAQVRALRIAVVARSAERDKDEVTQAPVEWNLGPLGPRNAYACNGTSKCLQLLVPSAADDSNHYRYKVYDTMIPLRNSLWFS